jgi:hypothetical protein
LNIEVIVIPSSGVPDDIKISKVVVAENERIAETMTVMARKKLKKLMVAMINHHRCNGSH